MFGLTQLLFLFIVIKTIRSGKQAKPEVWEGAEDLGLEWTLSSPPPYHSFSVQPQLK
jgi:cytochrome c oxidase subunit 1